MALTPRLDLRQSQTLVMTPQLQQAIRLLQLSNLELAEYVERELERNPLLERDEGAAEANGEAVADAPADAIAGLDGDYDNLWNSDRNADYGLREGWRGGEDAAGVVERTVADSISLRDHLINQINVDIGEPRERLIALHLADLLDDAGYLDEDLATIAARLGCPQATVEAVLARVQALDPPGVFARSLAECLALQLRDRGRLDASMVQLLEHLDLVAEGRGDEAARRLGITPAALAAMVAEIRSLHPKPGLVFDREVVQSVVPDVLVRRGPDGSWLVELNNDTLPRLLVDRRYYARISGQARRREDREYIAECLSSANWLVKSLDQRATTILRVASEIVRWQEGFLDHGIRRLRPLILRDIAAAIDMHESTISRVTTNKFMATPRGIFEMRYFFTNAIPGTDGSGEGHSAEAIRHRIKSLIAGEEQPGALSDDRIVRALHQEGVEIARRTVAKYREALGIPSSMERRRRARRRL